MFTRTRYQNGSLRVKKRGNGLRVWEFRYYDPLPKRKGRSLRAVMVDTLQEYPTEAAARKSDAVQSIILRINAEHTLGPVTASTVGALTARYEKEEDDVKTEYSRDVVPIAPELAKELLAYRERCYPTKDGWLFANPATEKPCHQEEIQKKYSRTAAKTAGIDSKVGWKTFRHSFRSWLDQTEAPIGVQRELMRHASIQTTMNVYGRTMTDAKRQAHSNVVQMILTTESPKTAAPAAAEKCEPAVNMV